jgi:hypothetical protein
LKIYQNKDAEGGASLEAKVPKKALSELQIVGLASLPEEINSWRLKELSESGFAPS